VYNILVLISVLQISSQKKEKLWQFSSDVSHGFANQLCSLFLPSNLFGNIMILLCEQLLLLLPLISVAIYSLTIYHVLFV
jgi:hypothetical protein